MARNFGVLKREQDKKLKSLNTESPMDDDHGDHPYHFAPPPIERPKSSNTAQIWLSALIVIAALGLVVYSCSARAHIDDHPELDTWMSGLQSKGGYPCCSQVDGSTLADVDWDTAVVNGENHYRVRINGVWIVVNPGEVVEGPNRYGPAIAWIYRDSMGVPNVRCFMPGAGL